MLVVSVMTALLMVFEAFLGAEVNTTSITQKLQ